MFANFGFLLSNARLHFITVFICTYSFFVRFIWLFVGRCGFKYIFIYISFLFAALYIHISKIHACCVLFHICYHRQKSETFSANMSLPKCPNQYSAPWACVRARYVCINCRDTENDRSDTGANCAHFMCVQYHFYWITKRTRKKLLHTKICQSSVSHPRHSFCVYDCVVVLDHVPFYYQTHTHTHILMPNFYSIHLAFDSCIPPVCHTLAHSRCLCLVLFSLSLSLSSFICWFGRFGCVSVFSGICLLPLRFFYLRACVCVSVCWFFCSLLASTAAAATATVVLCVCIVLLYILMGFIIHAALNKIQFACLAFSFFFALVRLHCSSKMDLLFRSTGKMYRFRFKK